MLLNFNHLYLEIYRIDKAAALIEHYFFNYELPVMDDKVTAMSVSFHILVIEIDLSIVCIGVICEHIYVVELLVWYLN